MFLFPDFSKIFQKISQSLYKHLCHYGTDAKLKFYKCLEMLTVQQHQHCMEWQIQKCTATFNSNTLVRHYQSLCSWTEHTRGKRNLSHTKCNTC